MGRIKVDIFETNAQFGNKLDEMMHNNRVKVMQYGVTFNGFYIVYESIHEGSPHSREGE